MITAKEARNKVLLQTKLKERMDRIEKSINTAIRDNRMWSSIMYNSDLPDEELIPIKEELEKLGYSVTYTPSKPLPLGCPADQWDFGSYLKVSWDKEETENGK